MIPFEWKCIVGNPHCSVEGNRACQKTLFHRSALFVGLQAQARLTAVWTHDEQPVNMWQKQYDYRYSAPTFFRGDNISGCCFRLWVALSILKLVSRCFKIALKLLQVRETWWVWKENLDKKISLERLDMDFFQPLGQLSPKHEQAVCCCGSWLQKQLEVTKPWGRCFICCLALGQKRAPQKNYWNRPVVLNQSTSSEELL